MLIFLLSNHKCFLVGPAPPGDGPQHAAALAPDLLVAGVTALVPAPTLPDRRDKLDSPTPGHLEYPLTRTYGLIRNKII